MATMLLAAIFPSFITMEKAQAQIPGFVTNTIKEEVPRDNNYNNVENGYTPNEIEYTTANSYDDEPYNGQYDETNYNEDSYSYNDNEYYSKYPTQDYDKNKEPIVNVKKKLFVCNGERFTDEFGTFFFCLTEGTIFGSNAAGPDSGQYVDLYLQTYAQV